MKSISKNDVPKKNDVLKNEKPKKELKSPKKKRKASIFVILFSLIFILIIASWIGYWATGANPDSQIHPAGILEMFTLPIQGFIDSASLIVFLFTLSVFVYSVVSSRALEAGIARLFVKLRGKEHILIITLTVLFSLLGSLFASGEMAFPFFAFLVPLLLGAGFDILTAVMVSAMAITTGLMGATINPVLVGNAVDAANSSLADSQWLSMTDGIAWRAMSFVVLTGGFVTFVTWYAFKVKKNPTSSIVYASTEAIKKESKNFNFKDVPPLTTKRKVILWIFASVFVVVVICSIPWDPITGSTFFEMIGEQLAKWFPYLVGQESSIASVGGWGIFEMGFIFLFATFIILAIEWKSEEYALKIFIDGITDFIGVALILSLTTGFSNLLTETGFQSLATQGVSAVTTSLANEPQLLILIMFILFLGLSFLIPSMSGFSRLVFPIIATSFAGATSGVTISGLILVFGFANGIINLFLPVSIAVSVPCQRFNFSLKQYWKATMPFMIFVTIACSALLLIGTVLPAGIF